MARGPLPSPTTEQTSDGPGKNSPASACNRASRARPRTGSAPTLTAFQCDLKATPMRVDSQHLSPLEALHPSNTPP